MRPALEGLLLDGAGARPGSDSWFRGRGVPAQGPGGGPAWPGEDARPGVCVCGCWAQWHRGLSPSLGKFEPHWVDTQWQTAWLERPPRPHGGRWGIKSVNSEVRNVWVPIPLAGCVPSGKSLCLSVPQSPHRHTGMITSCWRDVLVAILPLVPGGFVGTSDRNSALWPQEAEGFQTFEGGVASACQALPAQVQLEHLHRSLGTELPEVRGLP